MIDVSNHTDRRSAIRSGVLGTAALLAGPVAAMQASVAHAADTRRSGPIGTPLGCAVQRSLLTDPAYCAAIIRECDMVVTEDALKWDHLRPTRQSFDFADADAIVRFARDAGLGVRGHALVFHGQVPDWLDRLGSKAEAEAEMRGHIATVVGHYRGSIRSWDVVNEFTDDRPEVGSGLRPTIWKRLIGNGYIEMALRTAAEADPSAQLVLSDYFLEYMGEHYDARRAVMLRVVRDLLARGAPVHAVGMHGHLFPNRTVDRAAVARFVSDLRSLGVTVLVTELDVIDQSLPANLRHRDRLAAQQAFELLDAVAEGGGADAILTWGIRDRDSWTRYHWPRPDGLPTRALPFDDEFQPKPLHLVLQHFRRRVVSAAPPK